MNAAAPRPEWHRFSGAFANAVGAHGPGNDPTVGIARYTCSCCGREHLRIAAVAEDGREVNVSLPKLEALAFVERAVELVSAMDFASLDAVLQ